MRRRQFVASAASLAALSAGCLSVAPSSGTATTRARLDSLWFVNDSDEAVEAGVVVEDGAGERVYEASFALGAADGDGAPSSNVTRDPDLADPGEYVVRATVGGETATTETATWASSGENCVTAKFVRTTRGALKARPQTYETC